jgi:hypothetical protein
METSTLRKRMPVSALFDPKIVEPAIGSAFAKLDPRTLMKNPVMFVLEVVTALTTVILIRDLITGGEHIGFEFQINNTGSDKVFRTGSIYPAKAMDRIVAKDDEWFECHLLVKGNKVVLKVNGAITIDTTLPHEAKSGRTLATGTFAIQGHDPGSIVYFRSIRVKPLD